MDHGSAGSVAPTSAAAPAADAPVQWPLLAAIAVATLAVCLAATLLPCGCFRLVSRRAAAKRSPDETEAEQQARLRVHERRVAVATGCLTSVGAGVILATCFIGLMPAAASAYAQLCAGAETCLAATSLAPPAGCLAFCLLFWLIRSLVDLARSRSDAGADGETKPLVVARSASDADSTVAGSNGPATATTAGATVVVACCADDLSAMQDTTTAVLITVALLLKAVVEGLALPGMLRVASPLFVGLGKCLHEACCGLVLGLAWCESGGSGGASGNVGRWGLVALVAYGVATSGSILLGGLTASVHSVAGTAVQFSLLMAASGAGLQASFVHIVPRLPHGPASPALVLAGMLVMTLVAALHHLVGGGHHHG